MKKTPTEMPPTETVTDSAGLADLARRLAAAPYVAIDTEFMRETTFWPRLCLMQVASPDVAAIIDPLAGDGAMDLAPLFDLLRDPRIVKVVHAGRQDIEIFHNLGGVIPTPVFDTQVAAMVCGFGDSIAYDQLVARITGAKIDKSSRFTDWSARPLSPAQINYAVADVTYLRDVYLYLSAALEEQGRSDWVAEEMALLTARETYESAPEEAWRRLKLKVKSPIEFAILQDIAALREREAQSRDVPRSRVLKDDAIYEIATQKPREPAALARLRTMPRGFERSQFGAEIVATVARALARPPEDLPSLPDRQPSAEGLSAAIEVLKVLLKLKSERHGVAQKVIATVSDLEAIVNAPEAPHPVLQGWRGEVFGADALRLLKGEIAISFADRRAVVVDLDNPVGNGLPKPAGQKSKRRGRRGRRGERREVEGEGETEGEAVGGAAGEAVTAATQPAESAPRGVCAEEPAPSGPPSPAAPAVGGGPAGPDAVPQDEAGTDGPHRSDR